jgi:carboxylate-amine ligase
MDFNGSDGFTVGMELEFQLVDADTLDLADGILLLLELDRATELNHSRPVNDHVKPEMIQSSVEVISDPCANVAELEADLIPRVERLAATCESLGLKLCGAGTHPFCERLADITPGARYEPMKEVSKRLANTLVTFATHVHLGVPSGDEATTLMRELKPYLPVLVVLSAKSPFWHGYDTGHAAYRHRVLAATRSYGQPPEFSSWSEFVAALDAMRRAGVFANVDRVHWDLRPRPRFGTLEVRVMDSQPNVAEAADLAAFLRALTAYLSATRDEPESRPLAPSPWWMHKDNCFIASRYGRDARLIADAAGRVVRFDELFDQLIQALGPHADALDERAYLNQLARRVGSELGYERQRAVYELTSDGRSSESGSLRCVVADLAGAVA